jgi:hypothetical protein
MKTTALGTLFNTGPDIEPEPLKLEPLQLEPLKLEPLKLEPDE